MDDAYATRCWTRPLLHHGGRPAASMAHPAAAVPHVTERWRASEAQTGLRLALALTGFPRGLYALWKHCSRVRATPLTLSPRPSRRKRLSLGLVLHTGPVSCAVTGVSRPPRPGPSTGLCTKCPPRLGLSTKKFSNCGRGTMAGVEIRGDDMTILVVVSEAEARAIPILKHADQWRRRSRMDGLLTMIARAAWTIVMPRLTASRKSCSR